MSISFTTAMIAMIIAVPMLIVKRRSDISTPIVTAAKTGTLLLLSLVIAAGIMSFTSPDVMTADIDPDNNINTVFINEICTNNNAVLVDGHTEMCDYVELYNSGSKPVDLTGWYLSDKYDFLTEEQLGKLIIRPGRYALIYLGGNADDRAENVDLSLSSRGDSLILSNKEQEIIDSVEIPALSEDCCYVRRTDGGDEWVTAYASPLAANDSVSRIFPETLEPPVFSIPAGIYGEEFKLEISAAEGSHIFYTTDCSTPGMMSEEYTGPILIPFSDDVRKATAIRAIVYDENYTAQSPVVTETFFVTDDTEIFKNVYTVSLVTDERNLYDYETGIYITGISYDRYLASGGEDHWINRVGNSNWRKKWDRYCNVEVFSKYSSNNTEITNQKTKMSMHGNTSILRDKKSFNIKALQNEHLDGFEKIFPDVDYVSQVVLRNGGSESYYTKIRSSFMQSLVSDRKVGTQSYALCNVFLNGEFWGSYTIDERYGIDYLKTHYGADENNVSLYYYGHLKYGSDSIGLLNAAIDEYTAAPNEETYHNLSEILDIQSFIDYICCQRYAANWDSYPRSHYWWLRINDEPFTMMLYDCDVSANCDKNAATSKDTFFDNPDIQLKDDKLFMTLMQQPEFRQQFVTSFLDIAQVNFAPERVERELIPVRDDFSPSWQLMTEKTAEDFNNECQVIIDFYYERFDYITGYLQEDFNIEGQLAPITLNVTDPMGGEIKLNTTFPDLSSGSWTGKYFDCYPITVTALPKDGYVFTGWTGSIESNDDSRVLSFDETGLNITANFEKIR